LKDLINRQAKALLKKTRRKMASSVDIRPDLISTDAARDPLRPPGPRQPDNVDAVPGKTSSGKTVRDIAGAAPIERP
jgi:hypothetical protein